MAINISYQPAANLVGPVAQQAGQGMFQQRQQDRQQTQNNMLLQSQLADRQQRLGFALDSARLGQQMQAQQVAQQQDLVRMNFAANLQAQQQQFQQAMAVQQQQNDLSFRQAAGAQQLELQRQMGFAELDQNSQLMQLRNSTQANSAWQNLQAEQRALDEAKASGYITEQQHQNLSYAHAQKIAGFNPGQYALDGPFKQGEGMGDIWDKPVEMFGEKMTIPYTRDRNMKPVPTIEGEAIIKAQADVWTKQKLAELGIGTGSGSDGSSEAKLQLEQQKMQIEARKAAHAMALAEFEANGEAFTPQLLEQRMSAHMQSYMPQQAPTQQQPPQSYSERMFGGGNDFYAPGPPVQGGAQQPQQPMQQAPQQQQQPFPFKDLRTAIRFNDNPPPHEFASRIVKMNPQLVMNYLHSKYNDNLISALNGGNQDDLAMILFMWPSKAQMMKPSGN